MEWSTLDYCIMTLTGTAVVILFCFLVNPCKDLFFSYTSERITYDMTSLWKEQQILKILKIFNNYNMEYTVIV